MADGLALGQATVLGIEESIGVGSSVGGAVVLGSEGSIAVGSAVGSATVTGSEFSWGGSYGAATVTAEARATGVGSAMGSPTVTAVGQQVHYGVGNSLSISLCSAEAILSSQTTISTANAVSTADPHPAANLVSSAAAVATFIGSEPITEVSQANAKSVALGSGQHVLELESGANAESFARGEARLISIADAVSAEGAEHRVLTLVDGAAASSTATPLAHRANTAISTANATSAAPTRGRFSNEESSAADASSIVSIVATTLKDGATADASAAAILLAHRTNTLTSTANATSTGQPRDRGDETSTANATSALAAVRVVAVNEVSSGAATSSALGSARVSLSLSSAGVAASVVSSKLTAHQILLSSANATDYIVLPYGPRIAFWSNAVSTAAATWDGAPFETVIANDDAVYAAGAGGIYRLASGVDDNGSPVAAEVLWDLLDFGDPKKHRLGNVVIGALSAGPMNVRVINKQGRFDYPTHLPTTTKATNLRAKLGKGLAARYNRIALQNQGGRDFKFNTASVEVVSLSRRIGGT